MTLLLLLPLALAGEGGGSAAVNLHFGTATCGDVTVADCRWLDFQDLVVLGGHYRETPSPGVTVYLSGEVRLHPALDAEEVGDTTRSERVQPWTLEVPEAWLDLNKALFPALDLRVGQQRFAWGVGLGMNPVDVVNPYDLRDPARFDQRLGIPAISARLHHQQAAIELVYVPLFRPARMPEEIDLLEDAEDLFDFSDVGGGDVELGELETRTTFPDDRVGFAAIAFRASVAAPAVDLALVGYYGRDSMPQVGGHARLVGFATDTDRVDVGIPVFYPKMFLAGLEARAPLWWEIGGWVEAAVVFPERAVVTATRSQLEALVNLGVLDEVPDPLPETVIQDGNPFPRWVVGVDRFIGRFALNLQWIHGLPTERQNADISDYVALGAFITISEPVQLRLSGLTDAESWFARGELAVLHRDAATVTLGAVLTDGPEGSALGQLHQVSNVYLGLEAAF
ncbi:MAG: hypothetical protein JRI25_14545 [Deltaproteobacteria bacterium]|nr:hypothetical protein [Deltaproteobacteria bacterium]